MPLLGTRGAASSRGFGQFGGVKEPAPTVIGQVYGGGYYAGQISTSGNSIPTHYLVVAPKALGQANAKQWKTTNTSTAGTGSVLDGPTNSANMNNALHPAAQFCETLSINGYGDWYMPSLSELEICYFNLKPSAILNDTSTGSNLYAVPSRLSTYTSGNPPQTSAALFQTGGSEAFDPANYWSSTAFSTTNGWYQAFDNGLQSNAAKTSELYVRAIRRVAI